MKIPSISKLIDEFKWLAYPLGVLLLIFFTFQFMLSGSSQLWPKLLDKNQQVTKQRELLAQMDRKISALQQIDVNQVNADLAALATAMPVTKQVDLVVAQLRQSSLETNSSLVSYSSTVGSLSEAGSAPFTVVASLDVSDLSVLEKLISSLENKLPLLTIRRIQYTVPLARIEIEQSWSSLAKLSPKLEDPLPEYINPVLVTKSKLASFQVVTASLNIIDGASGSGELGVVTDPFVGN